MMNNPGKLEVPVCHDLVTCEVTDLIERDVDANFIAWLGLRNDACPFILVDRDYNPWQLVKVVAQHHRQSGMK